jgi:hypothetical protein
MQGCRLHQASAIDARTEGSLMSIDKQPNSANEPEADPDLDRQTPPPSWNADPDLDRWQPSQSGEFGQDYGDPRIND